MRTYLRFNNLGKVIRDAGFDFRYVAGVCGISKSTLSRYCSGDSIPSMEIGLKLCNATGYGFYDIWGRPWEVVRKRFYTPEKIGYKVQSNYHNNLQYFLDLKDLNAHSFAYHCGINYRTMKRYLRKETVPNVADGLVMAMALDVTVYDLFEKEIVIV